MCGEQSKQRYLCGDGELVVYIFSVEPHTYDDYRMWIGDGTTMRPVTITRFNRLRDGGTTMIDTVEGRFQAPHRLGTPLDRQLPSFAGNPLRHLDPCKYVISCVDGIPTVRPQESP